MLIIQASEGVGYDPGLGAKIGERYGFLLKTPEKELLDRRSGRVEMQGQLLSPSKHQQYFDNGCDNGFDEAKLDIRLLHG